jgi:hypothetical protein
LWFFGLYFGIAWSFQEQAREEEIFLIPRRRTGVKGTSVHPSRVRVEVSVETFDLN